MIQFFQRTPIWVWPLLSILIALGWRMTRTREVPHRPVIFISSAMLCLSGFGVITAFQGSALALLAWLSVLAISLLTCQRMGYPSGWLWNSSTQRLHVPGSWLPMVLFLTIFLIKFAVGAVLSLQPALAKQAHVSVPISAIYGLLSGIFAARAWRALHVSRQTAAQ